MGRGFDAGLNAMPVFALALALAPVVPVTAGAQSPASLPFAPPGQMLRFSIERIEREMGREADAPDTDTRRFRVDRTVRFTRDSDGYRAEVTVVDVDAPGQAEWGAGFMRIYRALLDVPMEVRLSAEGDITDVPDVDTQWPRLCDAIADAPSRGDPATIAANRARNARFAEALRAMPREERVAILSDALRGLIRESNGFPAPGTVERLRRPGRTPDGAPAMLEGTRARTDADGTVRIVTRLSGAAPLTGESPVTGAGADDGARNAGPESATIEDTDMQLFDPRTGLLIARENSVRTRIGAGNGTRAWLVTNRVTVAAIYSATP